MLKRQTRWMFQSASPPTARKRVFPRVRELICCSPKARLTPSCRGAGDESSCSSDRAGLARATQANRPSDATLIMWPIAGQIVVEMATANGARGTRTPDLLGAIQALSQLSYSPVYAGRRRAFLEV